MLRRTALLSLLLLALAGAPSFAANAADADTIAAINASSNALDEAFTKKDVAKIKALMTEDHLTVTPYYDGPQISSLPDLKYAQEITGDVDVSLIGDDAALRTFKAKLRGSFKGRPIARHVFVSQLMVKRDGAWLEHFYQVTALGPGKHKGKHKALRACRFLIGTYLTENKPKDASGGDYTSRSLLSLGGAHLALFTDSGEGGEAGFAPFTDGRGSWYCRPGDNGELKLKATTLDFTSPKAGEQAGGIGRLDFDLAFDAEKKSIAGSATLYLLPLDGDPLDPGALKDGREFEITGQRVGAPKP
jgi:hypothetical protein